MGQLRMFDVNNLYMLALNYFSPIPDWMRERSCRNE